MARATLRDQHPPVFEKRLTDLMALVHPWLDMQLWRDRWRPEITDPACGAYVRIIANPYAGGHTHSAADLHATVAYLRRAIPKVEICWTERPGHAAELAREAIAAGVTAILAAGGDGTLNEIAQELMGTEVALGALPMGTINVWAREMGIPLSPLRAAQALLGGERRVIDVGRVNGRVFLLMVGIGLDAEVTHVVEQRPISGMSKLLHYIPLTARLMIRYRGTRVKLQLDGRQQVVRALMIVISNTRLYGGAFAFTPQACSNDGMLDLCVIAEQDHWQRLWVFLTALLHRPVRSPKVRYFHCRHATISSSSRLHVQVDGEACGRLPVTVEVVPHALQVLVPAHLPPGTSLDA